MVGAGIEPDNGADLGEELAVFGGRNDPAAGGNDQTDAADQLLEDSTFKFTEVFFAVLPEKVGNRLSGFSHDKVVGIDEGEAGRG